jgi:hypothetical protein
MPRIVPSAVVNLIDREFPWANIRTASGELAVGSGAQLRALVDLVSQIPDELITIDEEKYAQLITATAAIRQALEIWTYRDRNWRLGVIGGRGHVLFLIRDALTGCLDEAPSPEITGMSFIGDVELRARLREDFGAANRALANGEWKGATVLAGSVVEALLLWALQRDASSAASEARRSSLRHATASLEEWDLHGYIKVARELRMITSATAAQAELARNFRNLIHPGRAQRLAQVCDRASALSAVAAVEHVVRDLSGSPVAGG